LSSPVGASLAHAALLADLAAVDALQRDAREAEVAVPELALDDDQRHAFVGHLDRVSVAQLVRREAAPDSRRRRCASQLGACRGRRPAASVRCAVDNAQQRTDRELAYRFAVWGDCLTCDRASSMAAPVASGRVFDHVLIAVSDLAASERFYRTVLGALGVEPCQADAEWVEWEYWDFVATNEAHPVTRGLHLGFRARDRAQVDAFWQAGVDAGYRDDGAPGPRTQYGPTYYGGFLLDPDGNSVEAVHDDREAAVAAGGVDHLWIRVRDLDASRRFYTTIAPHAGLRLAHDEPGRLQLSGTDYSFSLVRDERPLTEHVHLAFSAREDATVRAFHAAALAAGYEDNGAPGERVVYHPGYYGAFILDTDGHNI
jgi:catechol 2,3-dioxygenase-like lactoylglutathione lyase family enzyme